MHSVSILIYVSMYLYSYISYIWTGRTRWLSAIGGAPEDDDRLSSEIHTDAVMERVWRCNWRPSLSEPRDGLKGRERVNSEMHLEAVIEGVWRCTLRPWSSEFGVALLGRDRSSLELHFEAAINQESLEIQLEAVIEQDRMSTSRRSMDGAPGLNSSVI